MSIKATLSAFQNKFVRPALETVRYAALPIATKVKKHVERNTGSYSLLAEVSAIGVSGFVIGHQVQSNCSPFEGESLLTFKARKVVGFMAGAVVGCSIPCAGLIATESFAGTAAGTVATHVIARQFFNGNVAAAVKSMTQGISSAHGQVYDPQTKTFKPKS